MTETAKLYGGSLYTLAAEEKLEDRLLAELEGAAALFKQYPDYLRLLSTPSLPKAERRGLLEEAFGKQVHPYLLNFLKILCDNGTLRELTGCARAYRVQYNRAHGILEATAVSAVQLTSAQLEKLRDKLAKTTGKQINLRSRIDPAVLGGIRLEMEGVQLDGTVRGRLDALHTSIESAVL